MRKEINQWIFFVIVGLLLSAGCQTKSSKEQKEASAHNSVDNKIKLMSAWVRPGSEGGNSAAYLKIYNGTGGTDTLLGAATNAAKMAQVHESYEKNGLSGMRPAGKLAIAPGSTLHIKPGSYHIMLMRLNQPLAPGDSVQVTLHFSHAGSRTIKMPVKLAQ